MTDLKLELWYDSETRTSLIYHNFIDSSQEYKELAKDFGIFGRIEYENGIAIPVSVPPSAWTLGNFEYIGDL